MKKQGICVRNIGPRMLVTLIFATLILPSVLSGCGHEHVWVAASCVAPQTCSECGATEGTTMQHQWKDATCETPVTCEICGCTAGNAMGHLWEDATCTEAKICIVCSKQEGEPSGHTWRNATCTDPQTCTVCGAVEGEPAGHEWEPATYSSPKTCSVCGETEGSVLVRPEARVVGYYVRTSAITLQFSSNGSVFHRSGDSDWYGSWSVSGNTISFTLLADGYESPFYETATLVDGGLMWDGAYYKKTG